MKIIILLLGLLTYSSNSYSSEDTYPPKRWWSNETTFEEVEKDDERRLKWIYTLDHKHKCKKWKQLEPSQERIRKKECLEKANLTPEEIEVAVEEEVKNYSLANNKKWQKFKEKYTKGDTVKIYGAPELSGGFGIIIIRKDKLVAYFELGQS